MGIVYSDGLESKNMEFKKIWKEMKNKMVNFKYPYLTCVTERNSIDRILCLVIAEIPNFSMMWSAWIDKDLQIGDVVMQEHGFSFFVSNIVFNGENKIIYLKI